MSVEELGQQVAAMIREGLEAKIFSASKAPGETQGVVCEEGTREEIINQIESVLRDKLPKDPPVVIDVNNFKEKAWLREQIHEIVYGTSYDYRKLLRHAARMKELVAEDESRDPTRLDIEIKCPVTFHRYSMTEADLLKILNKGG